jgi:hypothetical protein
MYCREPVDWMKVGADEFGSDQKGNLSIKAGGPRLVEQLGGDKVVCQLFVNYDLSYRHRRALDAGCSYDYPEYQPHITVAEAPVNSDIVRELEPWIGPIELGPEIFEEIQEDWRAALASDGLDVA